MEETEAKYLAFSEAVVFSPVCGSREPTKSNVGAKSPTVAKMLQSVA